MDAKKLKFYPNEIQPVLQDVNGNTVVFKTTNYDIFKYYNFNRDLKQVDRLAKAIWDYSLNPILVNEIGDGSYYVVDGQHRLESAKLTKNEIYFKVINIPYEKIPYLQNGKKWDVTDWVKFWGELGKTEYIRLKEMKETYKIPYNAILDLVMRVNNSVLGTGHGRGQILSAGTLKLKYHDFAIKVLNQSLDYPNGIKKKSMFLRALTICNRANEINILHGSFTDYNHELAVKNMVQHPDLVYKCNSIEGYIIMIEKLLNFGKKGTKYRFI